MRSDCSLCPLRHFGRHCCCRQWGCGSFGLPGWVGDWADVYTSFRCGQVLAVREAGWAGHRGRLPRWLGLHASAEGMHSVGQLHLEETRVPTNCCLSCRHPLHTHTHSHTLNKNQMLQLVWVIDRTTRRMRNSHYVYATYASYYATYTQLSLRRCDWCRHWTCHQTQNKSCLSMQKIDREKANNIEVDVGVDVGSAAAAVAALFRFCC